MTIRSHNIQVSALPDEILLTVFSFLDADDILFGVLLVSKHWLQLGRDNILWKHLFESQYGTLIAAPRPPDIPRSSLSRRNHNSRISSNSTHTKSGSSSLASSLHKLKRLIVAKLQHRKTSFSPPPPPLPLPSSSAAAAAAQTEEEVQQPICWYELFKHAVLVNLRLCHAWSGLASVPPPAIACIWDTTTESELVSLFQSAFTGVCSPRIDTESNAQHISLCCVRTGKSAPVALSRSCNGVVSLGKSALSSSSSSSTTADYSSPSSSSSSLTSSLSSSTHSSSSSATSSSSPPPARRRLCKCSSSSYLESLYYANFAALDPVAAGSASETVQLGYNGKRSASMLGITTGDTIEMLVLHS